MGHNVSYCLRSTRLMHESNGCTHLSSNGVLTPLVLRTSIKAQDKEQARN